MAPSSLPLFLALCLFLSFTAAELNCPPLPSRPAPTSITDLRPNDIKVVMALGDSITAGFGLMGWKGLANEFRGQSWSIGADDNATTLFNFIKTYNPNLIGGSLGYHVVEICIDPDCPDFQYEPSLDVLNAAQSGAQVDDLTPHELDYLLQQMTSNPNIDMENDWKVMTLFIGANDLCGACLMSDPSTEPELYYQGVNATLEKIRASIPRVFVNIVNMFNLSGVYTLGLQNSYCTDFHKDFAGECPCIFQQNGTITRPLTDVLTQAVNQKMYDIQDYYQAQNYSDFAVIVQPFGRDTAVDSLPLEFISTLDCFHPSLLAHQAMAIAIWNNMLSPSSSKKSIMDLSDTPMCPTADTLLYTY